MRIYFRCWVYICTHLKWSVKLGNVFITFQLWRSHFPSRETKALISERDSVGVCYLFHPVAWCHPQSVWAEASLTSELWSWVQLWVTTLMWSSTCNRVIKAKSVIYVAGSGNEFVIRGFRGISNPFKLHSLPLWSREKWWQLSEEIKLS